MEEAMNRPIKFRALGLHEEDRRKWYYFGIFGGDGMPLVNHNTICQFTGLFDRKGKEIWEGDFVRMNAQNDFGSYTPTILKVFCNKNVGAFQVEETEDPDEPCWSLPVNCEVVGNIYQNPELLKQ